MCKSQLVLIIRSGASVLVFSDHLVNNFLQSQAFQVIWQINCYQQDEGFNNFVSNILQSLKLDEGLEKTIKTDIDLQQ